MTQDEAMYYANKVDDSLKATGLDKELYISIIIRESGHRLLVLREKGVRDGN